MSGVEIAAAVAGTFSAVAVGLFMLALAKWKKYKHLYRDALQVVGELRSQLTELGDTMDVVVKRNQAQDEIFKQIDDGELSLDELNARRSGLRPTPEAGT